MMFSVAYIHFDTVHAVLLKNLKEHMAYNHDLGQVIYLRPAAKGGSLDWSRSLMEKEGKPRKVL